MSDLWTKHRLSLPMGASRRDMVVGQTEWGAPVYQTSLGSQYWEPDPAESRQRGSVVRALADTASSQSVWDSVSGVAKALAQGVLGAAETPGRAMRGEEVSLGDAWDTAGLAQLGAAAMPAPQGAMRSGAMRTLYHGTSDEAADAIAQAGRINGPAYFTPDYSVASDYAQGGRVLSVDVPESSLMIDLDLPRGALLSADDAANYLGETGWTLDDFIRRGYSVGVNEGVDYLP